MLAHVPSFGRNPRGSPDFLAYPVPKACMHVLSTGVPRCLGVARSVWSPKQAQALGCSLTPGLRSSFGRVTCMARSASLPGLWTLGFQLLCGACVCFWASRYPRHSWLGSWVCVLRYGLFLLCSMAPSHPGGASWCRLWFWSTIPWLEFLVCAVWLRFWLAPVKRPQSLVSASTQNFQTSHFESPAVPF